MDELASLQESARKIALERFRIIQPCLEEDRSLSVIARKPRIPYRTIHRWLNRYRRFGLAALARKVREDRGRRRAPAIEAIHPATSRLLANIRGHRAGSTNGEA